MNQNLLLRGIMALETIGIVGGGIGGLASAIFLARKGFKVTVFDKAKSPCPVGAGFLLQPPGQQVLKELKVWTQVKSHSVPIYGLQSSTVTGRKVLDLDYKRLKGTPRHGLGVQRNTIYQALLNEALDQENVSVVWDSDVANCAQDEVSVSVFVNNTVRKFDLCILASGANSRLAEQHFKSRTKRPYGWGCLWTTFSLPGELSPNILHQRCQNTNKMMGILPVRRDGDRYEAALYWSVKSQELNEMSPQMFPALKNTIMDFWPDAAACVEPLKYEDFTAAYYNDIWTSTPFSGRVIAIGDISHATSPQLGQGCTMALLDARSLAMSLNEDVTNLSSVLEYWWRTRRYQLAYVRHLSKLLTPLFQSESWMCEVFRDWLMAPIGRLPLFDSLQLQTLSSEILLSHGTKKNN